MVNKEKIEVKEKKASKLAPKVLKISAAQLQSLISSGKVNVVGFQTPTKDRCSPDTNEPTANQAAGQSSAFKDEKEGSNQQQSCSEINKQVKDLIPQAVKALEALRVSSSPDSPRNKEFLLAWMTEWRNHSENVTPGLKSNLQYASTVLGKASLRILTEQIKFISVKIGSLHIRMQVQGCSAYCGLCALNNTVTGRGIVTTPYPATSIHIFLL